MSIDELVDMISKIAGKSVVKRHDTSRPQGVRGRNSDNSRLRKALGWEPTIPLRQGLVPTYRWIEGCVAQAVTPFPTGIVLADQSNVGQRPRP